MVLNNAWQIFYEDADVPIGKSGVMRLLSGKPKSWKHQSIDLNGPNGNHLALSQHKGKIIAAYYSQAVRGLKSTTSYSHQSSSLCPPQCRYHFKISDVRAQDKDAATLVRPLLSKLDDRQNERPRSVSLSVEVHHQVHRKVPSSLEHARDNT